ncbi:YgaP-like transmembrane domain [Halovenus marina]|jgi:hypothetical protein|uniref:YgaP-like transmembrane domain n=1 Tax=Halovenus marina TaxID=3396621 RepID=UPI003F56C769
MKSNIGPTDRTVRLALGALLVVLGLVVVAGIAPGGPVVGALALLVGVVLVGTALTRMCLVYRLVGVDTS